MEQVKQQYLTGERALFHAQHLEIMDSIFADGESPLKESRDIIIDNSTFQWKYPLWYSKRIDMQNTTLLETARSGIWYSEHITMQHCMIDAPKTFRQSNQITLEHVQFSNAQETLWNCEGISLYKVHAKGDYFGMNSKNINMKYVTISGNYAFDGAKNIEVHNSKFLSKDAFWNCENVVVYDSLIIGEYLGWNSKNVRFVNCTIESLQGMCYMNNVVLENCKVLHTSLAFEYSSVQADITTSLDSITNPYEGIIRAEEIKAINFEEAYVNPNKTTIEVKACVA